MEELFKRILTSRVYDVATRSPLDYAKNLSQQLGNTILLKREDLQPVFSFKLRGAYNKIVHLSEQEKQAGVICASAGNHAQGVALAAEKLGINATIVMPVTTPLIKVRAVQQFGGEVILWGDSYSEAADYCAQLVAESGKTYIHPFDDALVIAGQGTIAHELLQDCPDVDYIFVPIGGGGLIAGIAAFIKQLKPETKIIGVEPYDSDAMRQSILQGERVVLPNVGIFADGVAVKQVGELTYELTKKYVDDFITVVTDETCSAIKSIYEDTRSIVEPAGALAVAGLKKYCIEKGITGKKMVAINSGANMNFTRLQFVAERTLTGEKSEALFAVKIPEKAGALKYFCETIVGDKNITEFNYRLRGTEDAHIFLGININQPQERAHIEQELEKHDFKCWDLTDNELAKSHIRHMVGGSSPSSQNEVLYRFQFPERPQALSHFLNSMTEHWNISLFHYRMHGGDFGRVLIGLEIPPEEKQEFQRFLEKLNYKYHEESDNPAYRLFL